MLLNRNNSLSELYNDYQASVFIYSLPSWIPYNYLIEELKDKLLKKNPSCSFLQLNGNFPPSKNITFRAVSILILLFNLNFIKDLVINFFRLIFLRFAFKESLQLSNISVLNAMAGDIIAAEYLRRGHGKGVLKIDFRYLLIYFKYLVLGHLFFKYINQLSQGIPKEKIIFHFPETSFFDEMRRRILIKHGFNLEYSYNKYKDKLHLFKYKHNFLGRIHEYTQRIEGLDDDIFIQAKKAMRMRLDEGSQIWTANPTDVNNNLEIISSSDSMLDIKKPRALLCLHAVADDQSRCGLDCFKSIDDFHKFTIENLLNLNYQILLKAHPGVVSDIHPDKALVDKEYLIGLFKSFGLDYEESLISKDSNLHKSININDLYSINPKVSLGAISKVCKILVLTHHGSITFEARAMNLDVIKYKYCKAREFDYAHSWKNKKEYISLLSHYKKHLCLPKSLFSDSYVDVLANLSQRSRFTNYNDMFFNISEKYLPDSKLRRDIKNIEELKDLIMQIDYLLKDNSSIRSELSYNLRGLLG